MLLSGSEARGQGFSIGGFQVVSSNRVGRTTWDFVIRAAITNNLAAAQGISAFVFSTSPNTTPLQEFLGFGDLAAGSSLVSTGTVTIRQDRLFPFNPSALQWVISVESMPLTVNITSPQAGLLTNGNSLVVTGTVGPAVDTVLVGRTAATLEGTNFTVTVVLEEGRNTITALATNSYGGAGSANVSFTRDSTPPIVNIEAPANGAVLDTRQVTVTGMVNDIVPGTVNPEQVTVTVNGLPAMVANRSYAIPDVLLSPGRNIITVTARDKAGNASQRQIEVTYVNPTSQKRLVRLAGDAQTGMVGSVLPQPLVVELVDGNGIVQTNQPVTFTVTRNDGLISTPPTTSRTLSLLTDYQGQAQVLFQLGTRTGAGNHQVEVSSPGVAAPIYFCANATVSPPAKVSALIPETQVGETGKPLPKPWTAFVTDEQGNPVRDVPIVFMVFQGEGRFAGVTTVNTNTDSDGRASVVFTLGPDEGINNNTVVAIAPGITNSAATFTASGMKAQAVKDTRISGLVLDHANRPMSNIACRVVGTFTFSFTDAQGQFVISNAPVGAVRLIVDARNRRGHPGEWHYLDFDMVTVAGRDNRLDRPIYMLQLDSESQAEVGGDRDVTLHLKGIPGSSLTIFANSVRDPNGNPVVTNVTWTQVNADRLPMAPPLGSQPIFTTAIQPANLRFNPPARMCIPNNGLPPGQILEAFGFDHDIGAFASVGTATVSTDGSQICTDAGFGVVKSGWHPIIREAICSFVCSKKPADTECTKYVQNGDRGGFCNCPIYEPRPAKFELGEIKLTLGGSELTKPYLVCTGDTTAVSFSVEIKNQDCPGGLEYEWEFSPTSAGDPTSLMNASVTKIFKEPGKFSAKVTVKCKDCPSTADSRSVDVEAFGIELDELTFGGPKFDVYQDQGTQDKYPEPHWKKGRSVQSPVAYVRNTKMAVKATFKVTPASLSEKLKIKGEASGGFKLPEMEVSVSGGKAEYAMTAVDSDFPNVVGIVDPMDFKWSVGSKRGDFCLEDKAQNQVYVTFGIPRVTPTAKLFHTLLHIGCRNAFGFNDPEIIVGAIYSEFEDRMVARVNSTKNMTYWGPPTATQGRSCYTTAGLLFFDNATCGGWADFFDNLIKSQGIPGSAVVTVKAPPYSSTKFEAAILRELPTLTDPRHKYLTGPIVDVIEVPPQRFFVKHWSIPSDDTFNTTDNDGVAGQGPNLNPFGSFDNHAIVSFMGKYYDPSYGTSVKDSDITWEDESLDGFGAWVFVIDDSSTPPTVISGPYHWAEKRDTKGSRETRR